jgi:hypothetical protein
LHFISSIKQHTGTKINITYQENKSRFLDKNVWNTFVAGGALSDGVSPFSLLQEIREQPGTKGTKK